MEGLFANKYKIQSARLHGWDYSYSACYFVTICAHERVCYFGGVLIDNDGIASVALSDVGKIVRDRLLNVPAIYGNVRLDEWVIMPNHVHAIIVIISFRDFVETPHWGVSTGVKNPHHRPEWKPGILGSIINQFKGAVTKQCNASGYDFRWQPRFYDHIIRAESTLQKIRVYIKNNPQMWQRDRNNSEGLIMQ